MVKPAGDLSCTLHVFLVKEIHHVTGHVHAPGSVQAGRDAEGHFRRRQRPPVAELRNLKQGLEPDVHRPTQTLQSQFREHAVLAQQRNRIGDGCNGHNFHERHQQARLIFNVKARIQPPLHQSLRQLERHASAAQILAGIITTVLIWIHDH